MYLDFFELKEQPFNLTPDSHFLFRSQKHQEALDHLVFGISQRKGFVLITGEAGCGKTTLCRALIKAIEQTTDVAFILNPYHSEIELLRAINKEFKIPTEGKPREQLLSDFQSFLLEQRKKDRNVAVVVDESQDLPLLVLEQLRVLSNLETEKEKLLQIILVGQPELRQMLASPLLHQLNQRLAVKYHLTPFSRQETEQYIAHRLNVAGNTAENGAVFSPKAVSIIHKYSGGVPRLINLACDYALLSAFNRKTRRVSHVILRSVLRELSDQEALKSGTAGKFARVTKGLSLGAALALAAGVALMQSGLVTETDLRKLVPGFAAPQELPSPAAVAAQTARGSVAKPAADAAPSQTATEEAGPGMPASAALNNLMVAWKEPAQIEDTPGIDNERIEDYFSQTAGQLGFTTLSTWADWGFLENLGIPFIIEMIEPGGVRKFLTIASIDSRAGTVDIMTGTGIRQTCGAEAILKFFQGRSFVFFKEIDIPSAPLKPGDRSAAVEHLQQLLQKTGYLEGTASGSFDGATADAVKVLQKETGFVDDGIPGRELMFLLNVMEKAGKTKASAGTERINP